MGELKVGDVVGRKSYGLDVYFKVMDIVVDNEKKMARLNGLDMRLCATAPIEDLEKIESAKVADYWRMAMVKNHEAMRRVFTRRKQERERQLMRSVEAHKSSVEVESFDIPGRVLHVDGDGEYLDLCMTTYRQLSIPADGFNIPEREQAEKILDLLQEHRPDLLVLTGHDGYKKDTKDFSDIGNYYNSLNFVNAVKAARRYEKSRDDLVIFAGACQSHYEALLKAGANFASSPQRVLIHAFDPVFVVEKVAYTSIYDPIPLKDVITGTITGFDGIGGMETRGKHRLGVPRSPY
ncbi:spore coat assemly protein [Desulfotomaculum arcticum]|uniref:Spore coat assemly protein n=1 Tax=Desulfotruncus arcticus DSM 17038 TaxID=1121424 RepID=A0A1I2WEY8_9FIRM|nr:sporulation peptidase YabG [Desulfotruncus arcticus]SFG99217.1 spore coat assemly protein [Desulfotomaculum arcticum] [Desulfotruncus arcticus DSM 17038]